MAEAIGIRLGRLCACLAVVACVGAPATAMAQTAQAVQDRCLTCHVPFKNEDLAVTHLKAVRAPAFQAGDITCERCHGTNNDPHRADEDGLTPPEKMYARDKIAAMCSVAACHPTHSDTVSAEDMKKQVCTDCHGSHRMKVRIRIWDKETGKLLEWK